jgi:hypothetical protein
MAANTTLSSPQKAGVRSSRRPFSVMLTQTVDTQMEMTREPLKATAKIAFDSLPVLGGASFLG